MTDNASPHFEKSSLTSARTCEAAECYARDAVSVTIVQPLHPAPFVSGFLHLWAMYLRGFNHRFHCQRSLRGRISSKITTKYTPSSTRIVLDEIRNYNSLYICGVACGPVAARRYSNLHMALEWKPGNSFSHQTSTGHSLHVENAVRLPIPELPDGWKGLHSAYTRCRNFRFGVYRFGYPSEMQGGTDALHDSGPCDSIGKRSEAGIGREPLDAGLDSTTASGS